MTKYVILLLFLAINCTGFISCKGPDYREGELNIQVSHIEPEIKNQFIFNGKYTTWLKYKNDLYFPIELFDTTKSSLLSKHYFLKKRDDWLILSETSDSSFIINNFPLIPLTYNAEKNKPIESILDVFPTAEILRKSIKISLYKFPDSLKYDYEIKIIVSDLGSHGMVSTQNTKNEETNTQDCIHTFKITENTGEILYFSKNCKSNFLW